MGAVTFGKSNGLGDLEALCEDPDPDVRRQAVFWLSETGDPRAEAILLEILEQ